MRWTATPRRASEEIISAARDQYMRGAIEVDDFERCVEAALVDDLIVRRPGGRPAQDEWVRFAVEAHRRAHATP